jgi:hypothetical protein
MSYGDMTNGWNGAWWEDPQHAPVPLTGRGLREEIGARRRATPGNPVASKNPMLYGIPQDLHSYSERFMDFLNPKTKDPMLYGIPQDLEPIRTEGFATYGSSTQRNSAAISEGFATYGSSTQRNSAAISEGFATYGSRNAPLRYGGPTDLRAIEGMDGYSSKNKNPMLYGIPQDLEPIHNEGFATCGSSTQRNGGAISEGFATCGSSTQRNGGAISEGFATCGGMLGSNDAAPLKYQGPSDLYAFRDIKSKVKGVKESFASCGASGLTRRNGAAISEGFATHATDPHRMPVCVNRSTDAQSLLARIANVDSAEADELRLLMSKLCCMEADIAAPGAGTYRTLNLQFRTSQDTEPPVAIVSRCLVGAVNNRDTELIIEKFKARGHELIRELCNETAAITEFGRGLRPGPNKAVAEATAEFDKVLHRLELTMMSFCVRKGASMDRPAGPRDPGYYASEESDLSQYDGFSAEPK